MLSVSCTVTGGVMTAPATVSPEGCWTKARLAGRAGDVGQAEARPERDVPASGRRDLEGAHLGVGCDRDRAATPLLSVGTVAGPENVTLAPLDGAAKVTATPGTPLPSASCTLALQLAGIIRRDRGRLPVAGPPR